MSMSKSMAMAMTMTMTMTMEVSMSVLAEKAFMADWSLSHLLMPWLRSNYV